MIHTLRLPLGLEAPVMTPNGVIFLFFSFFLLEPRMTLQCTLSIDNLAVISPCVMAIGAAMQAPS